MATETMYTQAQYDGASRALTQTLAELRDVTADRDRLAAGNQQLRYTDGLLRAQVATLEQLRDAYAEQRDAALALVRDILPFVMDHQDTGRGVDMIARARALLDGAE